MVVSAVLVAELVRVVMTHDPRALVQKPFECAFFSLVDFILTGVEVLK